MKKTTIFILTTTLIILTGCGDKTEKNNTKVDKEAFDGLVELYDTAYKENSQEMDISLTFYSSISEKRVTLNEKITLMITNDKEVSVDLGFSDSESSDDENVKKTTFWIKYYNWEDNKLNEVFFETFKETELKQFFENLDIVLKNYDKNYRFEFGNSVMRNSYKKNQVTLMFYDYRNRNKSAHLNITKSDIDNMKKAYDYYKSNLEQEFLK